MLSCARITAFRFQPLCSQAPSTRRVASGSIIWFSCRSCQSCLSCRAWCLRCVHIWTSLSALCLVPPRGAPERCQHGCQCRLRKGCRYGCRYGCLVRFRVRVRVRARAGLGRGLGKGLALDGCRCPRARHVWYPAGRSESPSLFICFPRNVCSLNRSAGVRCQFLISGGPPVNCKASVL